MRGVGLSVVSRMFLVFAGCFEEEVESGVLLRGQVLFLVIGVSGRAVRCVGLLVGLAM